MKNLMFGWLLYCCLLPDLGGKTKTVPKVPFTGILAISWIGFGGLTTSSPVPAGVINLTAPTPFAFPIKVEAQQIVYYQENILVDQAFKPANPVTQPPLIGNWFVRRQVLRVKDGKTEVLQTTRLVVNKNAQATNPADQPLPLTATHLEYRLGRTEKIIDKAAPGKLPKTKTVEVFPHDAVRVAMPTATIVANTCTVKPVPLVVRPIPCEFQLVRFQILGKSGKVLFETVKVEDVFFTVPENEAKKTEGPSLVYDAKWVIKRIHPPLFPVDKGYWIGWGKSGSDFSQEVAEKEPLLTGLPLNGPVGKEFTIALEIQKSSPSSGFSSAMRELLLHNDVTVSKFPDPKKIQTPGSLRSESYIHLKW
ncbi:hypothetical protein ACO2Q8_09110 [Larkinella sp. VNQ87]|uniref:hypothetical protein n=1 Tax=Larkinella sp. VNQ87 TaxID=3400921 RepID=UPI003C07ED2B